jgi:hypothetical protein
MTVHQQMAYQLEIYQPPTIDEQLMYHQSQPIALQSWPGGCNLSDHWFNHNKQKVASVNCTANGMPTTSIGSTADSLSATTDSSTILDQGLQFS